MEPLPVCAYIFVCGEGQMIQVYVQWQRDGGAYLATSRDVPGLIVEAETRDEVQRLVPEIAHDLIELSGRSLRDGERFAYTWQD